MLDIKAKSSIWGSQPTFTLEALIVKHKMKGSKHDM